MQVQVAQDALSDLLVQVHELSLIDLGDYLVSELVLELVESACIQVGQSRAVELTGFFLVYEVVCLFQVTMNSFLEMSIQFPNQFLAQVPFQIPQDLILYALGNLIS